MCGFAGVVSFDERRAVDRAQLARMSDAIAHRGPDGSGLFLNHDCVASGEDPRIGLAFRRLAILDPDPRADQPMTSPDGRYTLVFNGEIYNFPSLRQQLSAILPDHEWRTTGDTEVLLMGLAAWGVECLARLTGMFALALWDQRQRTLLVARDRMGQKPLYYVQAPGLFAFASELGALKAGGYLEHQTDQTWLVHYLRYGYVHPEQSPYRHCRQLLPGTHLLVRADATTRPGVYFSLEPHRRPPPGPERFRACIESVVQQQMVSDVALGVFLSGGVDSSVIAACARQHGRISTFSIGFDDPRYDESPFARRVAEHLGTDHHEFHVTPRAAEDLPRLAAVYGEPFADSSALPTHYLSQQTRGHVKVALSGDGGDELFGGYDRYRAMGISLRLPEPIHAALTRAGRRLAAGHPKHSLARLGRFLQTAHLPPDQRYDSYLRIFSDDAIGCLLPAQALGNPDIATAYQRFHQGRGDSVEAALATDRVSYLPGDLLTKVDRASMLHGLEVRAPFMDHTLVELASGLTRAQLLGRVGKPMLLRAFGGELPRWVFTRNKMGFAVPVGAWFRTSLREMLHDLLLASDGFASARLHVPTVRRMIQEHHDARADHSQRLYALMMLELWWRQAPSA